MPLDAALLREFELGDDPRRGDVVGVHEGDDASEPDDLQSVAQQRSSSDASVCPQPRAGLRPAKPQQTQQTQHR